MSNAREHETSPLTPEQKQRAEAVRIAASVLPGRATPDDAIALADYILTGLHPAEFVGDAPEREAGDASATVKVTECQWPGCHERDATPADEKPRIAMLGLDLGGEWSSHPACVRHDNRTLYAG